MEAALSLLGAAALLLVNVAIVLALVILVLHQARYIVRLCVRLCAGAMQTQEGPERAARSDPA